MRSLNDIEKEYTPEEIAESFVFPGPKDPKERAELLEAFCQYRKKVSEGQPRRTKLDAQILQQKYQEEDNIN